jgi:hypothetical protein
MMAGKPPSGLKYHLVRINPNIVRKQPPRLPVGFPFNSSLSHGKNLPSKLQPALGIQRTMRKRLGN